mmetsp:Transcript_26539/g.42506  ORF Transcript_26539/g.42506 Transcript_26539/m.42506 type:complete len:212 (+) Transcript_26539:624-1259(+)
MPIVFLSWLLSPATNLVTGCSYFFGKASVGCSCCSTHPQSSIHAPSCKLPHLSGSRDRNADNIHVWNSLSLIAPFASREICSAKTSQAPSRLLSCPLVTAPTSCSKVFITIGIHAMSAPMIPAFMVASSSKLCGTFMNAAAEDELLDAPVASASASSLSPVAPLTFFPALPVKPLNMPEIRSLALSDLPLTVLAETPLPLFFAANFARSVW